MTTSCYGVLLGADGKVRTKGISSQVELDLAALWVVTNFLNLGGVDVILGLKCLETLVVNFRLVVIGNFAG